MNDPLVTVVVSCYNRPAMFKQALQSVLAQTYSELEILIQDDSTNEDCYEVVKTFSDKRIVYQRNDPPLGTSANLCAGYRRSGGKYFCTLNDDDLFDPGYLRTMVTALERNANCSVAFSDHYLIDDDGSIDVTGTAASGHNFGRQALVEGVIPNSLHVGLVLKSIPAMFALFRREGMNLDDFPAEVSSGYDYWLSYLALRDGHLAYYIPQKLTCYRVHKGSQTAGFFNPAERLRYFEYSRYIQERFIADPRLSSFRQIFEKRLSADHVAAGFAFIRTGNRREALDRFVTSWKISASRSALLGMLLCCFPFRLLRMALQLRSRDRN